MTISLAIPACPTGFGDNDDCTDLRQGVHPALDVPLLWNLLHPGRGLWNAAQLRDLTTTVANRFSARLHDIVRYGDDRRWWGRLALNDGVELWLLSWGPGQGTEPHDHGGASGSFSVLTGEVYEEYRYPGHPKKTALRRTGSAIGFGAGRAHQVINVGHTFSATVHAYSPPLVPTREYASLDDIPDAIPALTEAPVPVPTHPKE